MFRQENRKKKGPSDDDLKRLGMPTGTDMKERKELGPAPRSLPTATKEPTNQPTNQIRVLLRVAPEELVAAVESVAKHVL